VALDVGLWISKTLGFFALNFGSPSEQQGSTLNRAAADILDLTLLVMVGVLVVLGDDMNSWRASAEALHPPTV
jgi:hypothetical protein